MFRIGGYVNYVLQKYLLMATLYNDVYVKLLRSMFSDTGAFYTYIRAN